MSKITNNNIKNNNIYKYLYIILVISIITCCMETDIAAPSFPDISDYFNISDAKTQLIISINMLGFCISAIIYGPISDSYGRRLVMIIGNLIMTLGAVLCAISTSIEMLLFARFIQGLGASTSCVVAFAMVAESYPEKESARIIGKMNALITVCMAGGPIIGATINYYIGWRGNFSSIAVLSVISWLSLYYLLPETNKNLDKLMPKKILSDLKKMFSSRKFMLTSLIPSIQCAAWIAFVACSPFLYMETFGLSIIEYSIHMFISIAVFSVTSTYFYKISGILGDVKCINIGMVLILIFSTIFIFTSNPYLLTVVVTLRGIGMAISYPIIFAKSLEVFPEVRGLASSNIMSIRALVCAIGVGICSYFYDGSAFSVGLFWFTTAVATSFMQYVLLKTKSYK